MNKNIGIVCEGPTDYILLKGIVNQITGMDNHYMKLQPEDNLVGEYGNGWKGVWKWCLDNKENLDQIMKDISPQIDFLIVQMDGMFLEKKKKCTVDAKLLYVGSRMRKCKIHWNVKM